MLNIVKKILLSLFILSVFSCCALTPLNKEELKTAKSRAAQDRLNSTQQNSGSVIRDVDID